MIITVTDETEIRKCQELLCGILKPQLTKQGEYPLGSQAGTGTYNLHYDDKIWWLYHIWKESSEPLHSIVFGFCPLYKNRPNEMVLTLNIPLKGINRRVQSIFSENIDNKEYYILHRGVFSQRSKDSFKNWHKGKRIDVDDGGRREQLYYISNLNKPDKLIDEITTFMNEVIKFKNAIPIKR